MALWQNQLCETLQRSSRSSELQDGGDIHLLILLTSIIALQPILYPEDQNEETQQAITFVSSCVTTDLQHCLNFSPHGAMVQAVPDCKVAETKVIIGLHTGANIWSQHWKQFTTVHDGIPAAKQHSL